VLQVPDKLFELHSVLKNFRGFDLLSQTREDIERTRMYQEEASRADEQARHRDLDSYLRSLNLSLEFGGPEPADLSRVAQLTQKTNQFNLTTRRYTEGDIRMFRDSPDHRIVTMRVKDRFGDYGLTGVGMLAREAHTARLDLLLMSCRVLGRRVEYAFLQRLIDEARAWPDVRSVTGIYLPTAKNQQVANFLELAGFAAVTPSTSNPGSGAIEFALDIDAPVLGVPDYLSILDKTVA
jgi:FkbH-like protein